MCFHIHHAHSKPKKTIKDKKCYKVVSKVKDVGLVSLVQDFIYKKNKLYKTEILIRPAGIFEGFHSFTGVRAAESEMWTDGTTVIVECVIPKGSIYYFNPYTRQYVSNQIKILKLYKKK